MRSRKLLALIFSLLAIAPALAGYMTLLGAGVGSIQPVASWVSTTDPTFPSSSLTYSGPSLSTMFDSTGKLTYKPNNLLTYSNTFSNAAWSTSTATITSGVSDPLGGTNAWTLTATGAGALLYQNVTIPTSANGLFAVYVKRRTGSGTISLRQPAGAYSAVTITSSWTQVSVVGPGNGAVNIAIQIATNGDAIDIYAATVSAVTYETTPRTGDQVITTSAAYYGPRIDYDPNTLAVKGLLIEEARTNLAIQSAALTGASWTPQGSARGSDATLDLTGATAVKLTASAGAGNHQLISAGNVALANATTYTYSWYVKGGTHSKISIGLGDGTRYSAAVFDISGTSGAAATQTASTGDTSVSGVSTYLGSGWFRCAMTFTSSGASSRFANIGMVGATTGNSFSVYGEGIYTAAGTETIYVGQPQAEAGSFATSYIPTAAASVTRAADIVQFTGAALTALQGSAWSAAVQFADVASYAGNPSIFDTSSNLQTVFMNGNKAAFFPTSLNTANGLSVLASHRIAASATRSGGRSIVSDGGTVATDATAMTSPPNTYLGSNVGIGNFLNGHVASFAIYNQRLSDAVLQAKSVVGASYAANDNGVRFAFANDNLPVHWRIAL